MGRLADAVQRDLLHLEPPYGGALRHIDVEKHDGTNLRVQYCCPRAFLWLCCLVSVAFKTFLADHLPDGRSRVCLYCDDVRPGNVHRPENDRLYFAFYYTLVDLPELVRSSDFGWWDVAFVLKSKSHQMQGGISRLTEQLLDAMDSPMDFVVDGRGYQLSFDILLAEERATKEVLVVKGAGSDHPCC